MKNVLLIAALLGAFAAHAEVVESLDEVTYTAYPGFGQSLRSALDDATPIREDGKIFHGHTTWDIRWSFQWWEEGDGRCRITENETQIDLVITMPELGSGSREIRQRFARFREALYTHEQGHADRARAAAQAIDEAIAALPEMDSCDELERRANATGRRLLAESDRGQKRYDRDTEHGRREGASPD